MPRGRPPGSKNKKKYQTNNKLKRYNSTRYRGFKKQGSVNSMYHSAIPRTLQIATRRTNSVTLRFVKNLCYTIDPVKDLAAQWNYNFSIRANSIYDILQQNGSPLNENGPVIQAQDPEYNPTLGVVTNADGWERYRLQYQHFTVLGSKIQTTCQPMTWSSVSDGSNDVAPATTYIQLSGVSNQITRISPMRSIVKYPYVKRAQILAAPGGGGINAAGTRLYQFYSARKFEGVKDVVDNQQLRGRFENNFGQALQPGEQSFFNVGLVNTMNQSSYPIDTAAAKKPPKCLFRIKVEYIVKLTEPTNTNDVTQ